MTGKPLNAPSLPGERRKSAERTTNPQALAALNIPAPMQPDKTLRVCETCPFLIKNHRKPHAAKWYNVGNLRRLWNGLRTGNAPGMVCHSKDPASIFYGGSGDVKPGKEQECAGALLLILVNMNAVGADKPQPFTPPLTKAVIRSYAARYIFGAIPSVEDRSKDVGLPWLR